MKILKIFVLILLLICGISLLSNSKVLDFISEIVRETPTKNGETVDVNEIILNETKIIF